MAFLRCTPAYIGTCPTIFTSYWSVGCKETLTYNFYGLSETVSVESDVGTITDFSWPLEFYKMIPNAKSGDGELTYRLYNDADIDFTVSTTFTVMANESYCEPTIGVTITD
jgi:hypothetical protein